MQQGEDMAFEERNYLIFSTTEIQKINFEEVLETSAETLRVSVNQTKTFIKWDGNVPSFVETITTKERPYTHSEILEILSTEEWTGNTEYGTST
jgi:hypothetical protein